MKSKQKSFLSFFTIFLVSLLSFSCDPYWVMGNVGSLENVNITIEPEKKEYKVNEDITIKINGSLDEKNKTGHIKIYSGTANLEEKWNVKKFDGFTKESDSTFKCDLSSDELSSFTKEIHFSIEETGHYRIYVQASNDARPSNPYRDCVEIFEFDVVE